MDGTASTASMDSTAGYIYSDELNESSPLARQPANIKPRLKSHQLACLHKAIRMEKEGTLTYNLKNPTIENPNNFKKITMSTNIGIIGDIVGYGKTLTALSIIASSKLAEMHKNKLTHVSICSSKNYSYLSYVSDSNSIIEDDSVINSTLIIVPRGPVYNQWVKALSENTSLNYLAVENLNYIKTRMPDCKNDKKKIVDYFSSFDVVLVKNTTFDLLMNSYSLYVESQNRQYNRLPVIRRWKRVMVDEAHDIGNRIRMLYYEYIWLISGTYTKLIDQPRSNDSVMSCLKDFINYDTIELILVKCTKEFVRKSFNIPLPKEKYYVCKMNAKIDAIRNFISPSLLEKINANDIIGAIRDMGGKSETEDSMVELISKELKKELHNKEMERDYILSIDISIENRSIRVKNIEGDITRCKEKLENLTERITELTKKSCSICLNIMESPVILECTHSYCAGCIMTWITKNMKCPECRNVINTEKLIAIGDKCENEVIKKPVELTKEDTLLKIIKKKPNGKYLVFSKYDSSYLSDCLTKNDISFAELKGNTSHMMNVLAKFQTGEIKVILLNTYHAGSGIDISYATDVVIFHNMGLEKQQAIGRAQRVGRKDVLNIHYLYYNHEMDIRR